MRQRQPIAAVEGQSQALRPPPRPFVGVPPRILNFTGREAELDRLDAVLLGDAGQTAVAQAAPVGRAAVQGMGGIGKTALAVEYAYRYRDLYAGIWCSKSNRSSAARCYVPALGRRYLRPRYRRRDNCLSVSRTFDSLPRALRA